MFLLLTGILFVVTVSVALIVIAEEKYDFVGSVFTAVGSAGLVCATICLIAFMFLAWDWQASSYKADIINREYGTKYTQEEIFYASDVIDTVRQLDRKRYEVNGDLLGDKRGKK